MFKISKREAYSSDGKNKKMLLLDTRRHRSEKEN